MTKETILPPFKPLPIKDRISVVYVEKGNLDVLNGAFVVVDKTGVRTHLSVGSVACLMLEPGTRVSHSTVVLAARVGCLLVWIGEAGVRFYQRTFQGIMAMTGTGIRKLRGR